MAAPPTAKPPIPVSDHSTLTVLDSFILSASAQIRQPSGESNWLVKAGLSLQRTKIIYSQFPELDAQPSPDGTRIAWMSKRTGFEQIFVSDFAGHDQQQLTHLDRYWNTSMVPRQQMDRLRQRQTGREH
jgi:hypothetical protein